MTHQNIPFFNRAGYTEAGFIKESPGSHGAVRFRFKPCLLEERTEFIVDNDKLRDATLKDQHAASELAKRIVEWNLTDIDKDGNEVPAEITAKNILSIRAISLVSRLQSIVIYGSDVSDIDPEWENGSSEKDQVNQVKFESALSNRNPGDVRENLHLGN